MSHDEHLPGYTIRRPLGPAALMPAVGVGIAVGLAAFYVTRVMLERTELLTPEERARRARALERRSGKKVTSLGGAMVGVAADLEADEPAEEIEEESYDDYGLAERVRERLRATVRGAR